VSSNGSAAERFSPVIDAHDAALMVMGDWTSGDPNSSISRADNTFGEVMVLVVQQNDSRVDVAMRVRIAQNMRPIYRGTNPPGRIGFEINSAPKTLSGFAKARTRREGRPRGPGATRCISAQAEFASRQVGGGQVM